MMSSAPLQLKTGSNITSGHQIKLPQSKAEAEAELNKRTLQIK
jgi:hypothetical protein